MHDCVPLGTGNSRSLKSSISAGTTWEQALAMLRAGTFPIDLGKINEEGVAQKGDPLNQETLLKTAVAALYGKDDTAVPSDIFQILSKAALVAEDGSLATPAGTAPTLTDIIIGSYTGTGTYGASNPVTLFFEVAPKIIIIRGDASNPLYGVILFRGVSKARLDMQGTGYVDISVLWGENSVSFYSTNAAAYQLNESGKQYSYGFVI